jgi:NAD kinase
MVFSPNSRLEAVNNNALENGNILLSDGRSVIDLEYGDRVVVTRSDRTLELIKLKKDAFYETLYNKMS